MKNPFLLTVLLVLSVHASLALPAQAAARPKRVACVGASITWGAGASDQKKTSYPARLQALLGKKYEVRNFGHSGACMLKSGEMPYSNTEAFRMALAFNPAVVLIDLGGNDTKPGNWRHADEFEDDTRAMINAFRSLPAKPQIFLMFPGWIARDNFGITGQIGLTGVIPLLAKVAREEGVCAIDMTSPTLGHAEYYVSDGVHLNDMGYAVYAKVVAGTLLKTRPCFDASPTQSFTRTPNYTATVTPTPESKPVWRVNCGGEAALDSKGRQWEADTSFSNGNAGGSGNDVAGTLDQAIYKTERWGAFTYFLGVPPGTYEVTLKFAELFDAKEGQRVFDITINGAKVLDRFEVLKEAGGMNKPLDKVFSKVRPKDGVIAIEFTGSSGSPDPNAKVNGIQVEPETGKP